MNLRLDLHILGWLLALLGLFQLPSVAVAAVMREPSWPYVLSAAVAAGAGAALALLTRVDEWRLRPRDGFIVVGTGWVAVSFFGAVPYVTTGALGPLDALFESVSGFTTTGSTVMAGLADAPGALLLWRSFTQWVGGMGIILFTIAILPLLGIGGMQLFKAEVPGPVADRIRPRLVETARRLWLIYVGLTLTEIALLALAGMPFFEAICHGFTTLATGGFSTRDASVGDFGSVWIEWIVIAFMLLAGVNFVLHYRMLTGRARDAWRDAELRYFLLVVVVATGTVALVLLRRGATFSDSLRLGAFQVVSILTTTGYVTADFELWPSFAHAVLLALMILGGMSGSTAGGIKSLRALLGVRALFAAVDRLVHPRAVRPVKYADRPVPDDVLAGIWAFLIAYALIAAAATAAMTATGYDLDTALSAALTAIGNVGPGLGAVGAYDNFAHFPAVNKLVLVFCMLAGRLEIFTLVVLFMPGFWRR
jgi:trk system potassium uptake protein TrkH